MTEPVAARDELVDRLFTAIGEGDAATIAECLADDVVVWTNFDGREAPKAKVLPLLVWMHSTIADLRYEIVSREPLADGLLQRHVLHGRAPSGVVIAMPACIIARVVDGRVARMDEYTDPTPLLTALA